MYQAARSSRASRVTRLSARWPCSGAVPMAAATRQTARHAKRGRMAVEGYTTARIQERLMMKRAALALFLLTIVVATHPTIAQRPAAPTAVRVATPAYFPERFDWQHKKPEEVGMNSALVNEAVQLAIAAETPGPKN